MAHCPPERSIVAALLLSAGATCALGQDSVSTTNALPGDAVSPYTVGASQTQVLNYIVDLAPKNSSWGNPYNIGPVVKSSLSSTPSYFNHLIASQAVSNRFSAPGPLLRSSYSRWTTAGGGINPSAARNTAGTPISSAGITAQQFSVSFLEYAGGPNAIFGDGDDENNIITSIIGFDPANNKKLYVSRIVSATNRASALNSVYATANYGLGGVDELGNVAFYADGFNCTFAATALTNRRLYRVASAARLTTLNNQLANATTGDAASTTQVFATTGAIGTPTLIPTIAAARAVVLAADFANNELVEQTAGSLTTITNHLGAGNQQRGPMSFTARPAVRTSSGGNNAGIGFMLSRGPGETKTRGISLWGMNTDGTTDIAFRFALPTLSGAIIDPVDSFNPASTFGSLGNHEFMNYQSQVSFRGPSGPVAGTVLPNGDILLAAGVAATGGGATTPQSMDNYIAVAKLDNEAGFVSWSIAAHTGNSSGAAGGLAKSILGISGAPIGTLAKANEVNTSASTGPSISPPALDRLGNLYFIACVKLNGTPATFTNALIRGNRNSATGGYQLEMLAKVGDVVLGQNSAKNYQIQFMGIADADSVDSGSVWPTSIVQDLPSTITNPAALPYASPSALGALMVRAKIVYDMNSDGLFVDPSAPGGSGSPDQAYNVLLAFTPGGPISCQPADIADDQGNPLPTTVINTGVNEGDYNGFFAGFFNAAAYCNIADDQSTPMTDPNRNPLVPNSGVNEGDYNCFFQFFFQGCP